MKLQKLSMVAGLVLSGLLACSSMAMAQDAKPGKEGGKRGFPSIQQRLDHLSEALTLTDDQKPKVKAALEAQAETMKGLKDATQDERREKMKTSHEEFDAKMKGILTPEQYTKFEAMPRGGPGGRKKGGDKKE
jgi:periplasmic protein CpxP/Spy